MPRSGLLVYMDSGQPESRQVVEFLRSERCHFIQRDVSESGMAEMELEVISGSSDTPVTVWEGHTVCGFDEPGLRALIDRENS